MRIVRRSFPGIFHADECHTKWDISAQGVQPVPPSMDYGRDIGRHVKIYFKKKTKKCLQFRFIFNITIGQGAGAL